MRRPTGFQEEQPTKRPLLFLAEIPLLAGLCLIPVVSSPRGISPRAISRNRLPYALSKPCNFPKKALSRSYWPSASQALVFSSEAR